MTISEKPLVGRDMICFSHDWTGDPLSKTHLMRILARDNRILWVNSIGYRSPSLSSKRDLGRIVQKLKSATARIRQVEKNLFVMNPLAIPSWGRPAIRKLNTQSLRWQVRRAMRQLRFHNPINWVFNPAAGDLAGRLGEDKIIYYCVDEYTAFAGVNSTAMIEVEQSLLCRADLVIASAESLQKSKVSPRSPTILIRHGVDYDHFRKALDNQTTIPEEMKGLPRPIIGYFGLIAEDWVDLPLLIHVAREFRQGTLVLLGKSTMDISALTPEPNVRWFGRKPYESLPGYCKAFDAAIIPFPVSPVTLNANPLKAREYLAAGLPVVSTPIPEVEVLGQCEIGRNPSEFVERVRHVLKDPGPKVERSASMSTESWWARVEEIREVIRQRHWTP